MQANREPETSVGPVQFSLRTAFTLLTGGALTFAAVRALGDEWVVLVPAVVLMGGYLVLAAWRLRYLTPKWHRLRRQRAELEAMVERSRRRE